MRKLAMMLALPLFAFSTSASAQSGPSSEQMTALMSYALPTAFESVREGCDTHLPEDSYLYANAERLAAEFEQASEGTFALARQAVMALGGLGNDIGRKRALRMDDEEFADIMDAEFRHELGGAMGAGICGVVDRLLEQLEPLPAENLASFLGILLAEVGFGRLR